MARSSKVIVALLDQVAFGANSVLLVWMAARWGGVSAAGIVSLVLVPVVLGAASSQGLFVDAMILDGRLGSASAARQARRNAFIFACPFALACLVPVLASHGHPMAALASLLGGVAAVTQAVCRAMLLAQKRVFEAFRSDIAWLCPQVVALVALITWPDAEGRYSLSLVSWGVGAVLGLATLLSREDLNLSEALSLRSHLRKWHSLAYETLVSQGVGQGIVLGLATFGSSAVAGTFRTAQTFTSPILLIAAAGRHPLMPWIAHRSKSPEILRRLTWFTLVAGVGLGVVTALGMHVGIKIFGNELLGAAENAVKPIIPIVAVDVGLGAANMVFAMILRGTGRVKVAVTLRGTHGLLTLVLTLGAAALTRSAETAALCLLISDMIMTPIWFGAARRSASNPRSF